MASRATTLVPAVTSTMLLYLQVFWSTSALSLVTSSHDQLRRPGIATPHCQRVQVFGTSPLPSIVNRTVGRFRPRRGQRDRPRDRSHQSRAHHYWLFLASVPILAYARHSTVPGLLKINGAFVLTLQQCQVTCLLTKPLHTVSKPPRAPGWRSHPCSNHFRSSTSKGSSVPVDILVYSRITDTQRSLPDLSSLSVYEFWSGLSQTHDRGWSRSSN